MYLNMKVIVWGYPLHSHTHSYIHYGWVKAFKHLGYDTYWFDDTSFPSDFDYTHCLFITEGYADNKIPLHSTNTYCVHVARNPYKYISCGARFIDIRYNVLEIKDCNYNYRLADKHLEAISPVTLYEQQASSGDLNKMYQKGEVVKYEAVYMCWATDLLPDEFNLEDRFIVPEAPPVLHFIGTIGSGNAREIGKYLNACSRRGIRVFTNDPWKNPLSFEEAKRMVQRSVLSADIRGSGDPSKPHETGTCHKQIGYIPCRLFKSISYGKLGASNCKRLYELFGDKIVFCEDEDRLVDLCLEKYQDMEYIREQMEWVRDHHTYLNRVADLLEVVLKRNAV